MFPKTKVNVYIMFTLFFYPLFSHGYEMNDWRSEWSLEENFDINIDTDGYHFPTALAFVPDPGKGSKDPLYFVTELRGKVKVVTNDRTVYTFAEDFFKLKPDKELPDFKGENGLAGICLDPKNGYVFVTFAYQDEKKIIRNNIVRFDSIPGTFSLKPSSLTAFTDVFKKESSSPSHQIGPCQVNNNVLYVGVGDGFDKWYSVKHNYLKSQDVNSLLGKILRMTLDGKPVKSNPYYSDSDITKAKNYVWASGLRNPFGLEIVNGRVFVSDNGPISDRFIEVHKGGNYLWDGTEMSITANANLVFVPGPGVTQLDYFPKDLNIFPERYRGRFYQALCGDPGENTDVSSGRSVTMFDFSFEENKLMSPPYTILQYRGAGPQSLVGFAIGPDGLYFAPLMPIAGGASVVFRLSYNPETKHPYSLRDNETFVPLLLEDRGCYGCHMLGEARCGAIGPDLDSKKLVLSVSQRLQSEEYRNSVRKLDQLEVEPYRSYRDQRAEILGKKGIEMVRTWVKYHIIEPKFDNPDSMMPNLGIDELEAELIALYLVPKGPDFRTRMWEKMKGVIPTLKYRYLVYSFILGTAFSFLIIGGYIYILRKKQHG